MSFLIDTDICSAHLRGAASVISRFTQYTGRLHVLVVSLGELKTWLYRKNTPARFTTGFAAMMQDFVVLPLDQPITDVYGQLGAALIDQGLPIGAADLQIAATALAHNLTLVTHNTRHFGRVPGLSLADWLVP